MAYSFVQYNGTGGAFYAIPFPYLSRDHVAVLVNGIQQVQGTDYSIAEDGGSITFITSYPALNIPVRILRNSSRARRLAAYQDAQIQTKEQMDADALQIFYVAQEAFDAVAEAATGGDMRRSMNLSDVYDPNAARGNIGALNVYGDTMLGRLLLTYTPTIPSEAATKGYVDSLLGSFSSGVASFNTRVGAVSLLSADVTGALGYTPVNKAGDTMTGALTLAGAPTSSLHAATKAYVDAAIPGASLLSSDNVWTGKNWHTKLDTIDNPSIKIYSENDGPIVTGDSYPGSGNYYAFDVIKTTDQSVQSAGPIRAAQMVRMRVKGTTVSGAVNHAVAAYMDYRGAMLGSVVNAGGSLSGNTANRGTGSYTWGAFGENTHNNTGGTAESYGVLGSSIRNTANGYQASVAARVFGGGGYLAVDAGVVVNGFGNNALAKAIAAFAAGSAYHGDLKCDFGLDLKYATADTAAIRMRENTKLQWGMTGSNTITTHYDQALGVLWTGISGNVKAGVNINSSSYTPGTRFQWDGVHLGASDYYMDLVGNGAYPTSSASPNGSFAFSFRSGGRFIGPVPFNPNNCAGYIPIKIDGDFKLIPYF